MADSINTYDIGEGVWVQGTWRVDGELTDPDEVVIDIRNPVGDIDTFLDTSPEMEHPGDGVFRVVVIPDLPGRWRYRVKGTGAASAIDESEFRVVRSDFEGG